MTASIRPLDRGAGLPSAALRALGAGLSRRLPPPRDIALSAANDLGIDTMSEQRDGQDLAAGEPTNVRILVALAAMSTRQDAMMRATDEARTAGAAQHRELMERINTFVPRSEIEKDNKAIHERIDELEKRHGERLDKIEGRIWKAVAWLLGTIGTAFAGMFGLSIKGAG